MRSLCIRSPWSIVRCGLLWGAIAFTWLMTIHSSPAQQDSATEQSVAPVQEKKSPAGPESRMSGRRGGSMGERLAQPAKPAQAAEPTLEESWYWP